MRILKNFCSVTMLIIMGLAGLGVVVILLITAWFVLANFIGIAAAIVMPIVGFVVYMGCRQNGSITRFPDGIL